VKLLFWRAGAVFHKEIAIEARPTEAKPR
jgi:hypothetical protein